MTGSSPGTSVSYPTLLSDVRLWIVLLITAAGILGNVLPPALPALAAGLNVGDKTIGYLITAYKLPSVFIIPLAAVVADVYGRRMVLLPSLLLYGAVGTAMFFITSFSLMLLFALFLGVGAAAIHPISVTLLSDFFKGARNSAGQGIRVAVVGIGAILIPAATGYISGVQWSAPFLLFLFTFPVLAVVYVFLQEPIERKPPDRGRRTIFREYLNVIRTDLSTPALAVLLLGGFFRGFSRYALLTFVPLFAVSQIGASLLAAGALLSVRGVVYILVAPFAGELVRTVSRKWLLAGSLSVSGLALVLLPFVSEVAWLGVLVGLHTFGDAVFDPVNKGAVTGMARQENRAGVVNTLYVLKRVGQTSSPAVFGSILAAAGYYALFVSAGAVVGAYVVVFVLLFAYVPVSE